MLCVLCLCVKSLEFGKKLGLETLELFQLAMAKNSLECMGVKETLLPTICLQFIVLSKGNI